MRDSRSEPPAFRLCDFALFHPRHGSLFLQETLMENGGGPVPASDAIRLHRLSIIYVHFQDPPGILFANMFWLCRANKRFLFWTTVSALWACIPIQETKKGLEWESLALKKHTKSIETTTWKSSASQHPFRQNLVTLSLSVPILS